MCRKYVESSQMTPVEALNQVRTLADTVFRPRAEEADCGRIDGVVAENVRLLASRGLFGMGIAREYGGIGADEQGRREFTEIVASACGVTAFTQQQLHAGGAFALAAMSDAAKASLLPRFASGELLCGIAFSHLRRPGAPIVTARAVDGGWLINGRAPWVTGWSLLDGFILGATVLSDCLASSEASAYQGSHLYVYVSKAGNEASLTPSDPITIHVMNASDTVEVTIRDLFIADEDVAGPRPAEDLRRADYCGISGHVYMPLGCARGSVHYLRRLAKERGSERPGEIARHFETETDACRREALTWSGSCADAPNYKEKALQARAWSIDLAVRAAHAAVASTGGSGQRLDNPAQRLMREAVFYTTLAQTPDVQSATLDRLMITG